MQTRTVFRQIIQGCMRLIKRINRFIYNVKGKPFMQVWGYVTKKKYRIRFMEENLKMPLWRILEIMQERIVSQTSYGGISTNKNPLDFWIYQEIIFQTKPDWIIEMGNFRGGSTLALAHICDHFQKGRIIGIDLSHERVSALVKEHPRITLVEGDACESFKKVQEFVKDNESVMVIEDSAHTFENTLNILRTYSSLVKPGHYFIIEDSICHHGLWTGPNPGPYEAIETFLNENKTFEIDRSRESFFITWNPKGYLKKL